MRIASEFDHSLGFLIAEEYDFGSARSVNGLFQDLLNITPFSKKEAPKYSEFLNDRNLLVHHGGVYTTKYKAQRPFRKRARAEIYFDSLVIKKSDVNNWSDFLLGVAAKMGESASKALMNYAGPKRIEHDLERKKAIEALADLSLSGASDSKN